MRDMAALLGMEAIGHAERMAAALRLLGRLEFVPVRHLHALIYPDRSRRGAHNALQRLHEQHLVWRMPIEAERMPRHGSGHGGRGPLRLPLIYGLTPEGRTWLEHDDPQDAAALRSRMVVRDWAMPEVRRGQLAHDLLVVDWCCAALRELRRCPAVAHIWCELEYISARDPHGQPLQRVDAVLAVSIDRQADQRRTRMPWEIPWMPMPQMRGERLVWAIEVDRGTEKLVTLLGKAVMYRDLSLRGHYQQLFGTSPLPVLLAPSGRRAAQIAREWLDAWPEGRGVISTFAAAQDSAYGPLWGRYRRLGTAIAQPGSLWEDVQLDERQWRAWVESEPEPPTPLRASGRHP